MSVVFVNKKDMITYLKLMKFQYDNKSFFYTIDTIMRAIEDNKQISFTYNEFMTNKKTKTRFDNKVFIINPYFIINNRGKYYLVCNYYKYDTFG